MDVLTLGRYILEMSLMDYKYTKVLGSQLAAAALLVAMSMKKTGSWVGICITGVRNGTQISSHTCAI